MVRTNKYHIKGMDLEKKSVFCTGLYNHLLLNGKEAEENY